MSELPLDAYYDLTQVGPVAVSPDGDRVAFTTTEYDPDEDEPVSSLFVAPTDGSRDPHRLTRVSGAGSPTWAPDGDRLAFIAARDEDSERRVGRDGTDDEDADADAEDEEEEADDGEAGDDETPPAGGDEPKPQVWLFDLALGGDARQLTAFEEGVREFDWSPDGDRLVVAARDPTDAEREYLQGRRGDNGPIETERTQHKLDGVGYTDTVTTYLFVVDPDGDADDAESADRLDEAYGAGAYEGLGGLQPDWGASGDVAFVSARDTPDPDDTLVTDLYTVDPDSGDLTRVTDGTLSCGGPTWSPDGERLAFRVGDPDNWCVPDEAYVWDGEEYASLTADLDRTLARGSSFEWADDSTFYTLIADESRTRMLRVDADGGSERVFEAQGEDRALPQVGIGGDAAVVHFSDPQTGSDLYRVDVTDLDAEAGPDSLTRLSEVNAAFTDDHEMPEVTRVEWESDGWDVDGVVYHPPEFDPDDPEPFPLVVAIHGGPLSYDEPVFSFDHAALTSRGYVVLRPNYRGGTSYGRKFAETLYGQWGTVEVEDVANGVADLVDRGWADPERVFGYGFSYGGIAQGYLVTQRPDLFTAAAPEHGLYDLRSAFGTDDSHVGMENEFGLPWEDPEDIDASSAITDADNIETPLLVTAGTEDWRCPPSQSEQLYLAAKKNGVDARLVLYPGEHHNIGTPDRAIHRLEELTAWYRRHDPEVDDESATDPHGREEADEDADGDDAEN